MDGSDKPRVLLVDDNDSVRKAYTLILKAMGWEVSEACRADDAYSMAEQNNYHLAILDISMPGMSGLEFCVKLKQELPGAVQKIIVISGVLDAPTSEMALAAGANQFLKKPIGFMQLKEALAAMGLRAALA